MRIPEETAEDKSTPSPKARQPELAGKH